TTAEIVRIGGEWEIEKFHAMLSACLSERHEARPVHSACELKLLHSRFPEEIQFYAVEMSGELHAGVCLFVSDMTVHTQYICSTPAGREKGLLSLLMQSVINHSESVGARYLDFGTCNEDRGRYLNLGLAAQKYGLGGTGVSYERYRLQF
ncbi:MAG: GNAT family N-acetyltransferase, partial [Muribaculaceae bacterium]|nr:GNAT family N-acetyltransferase [Muribaculaceae bacterium]